MSGGEKAAVGEWFAKDEPVTPTEMMALRLVAAGGPHQVGVIDSEETFAAAYIFVSLTHKGCVIGVANERGGPTYHLTTKGRSELAQAA